MSVGSLKRLVRGPPLNLPIRRSLVFGTLLTTGAGLRTWAMLAYPPGS